MKITDNASEKIREFNKHGLHYNLVADAVYKARNRIGNPFFRDFLPYFIAALLSFDMGRMMGPDSKSKYDDKAGGFATKLGKKINLIQPFLNHLVDLTIGSLNIESEAKKVITAYDILSSNGKNGLHQQGHSFHVGATKLLHFSNPNLFIIIDSNASRAFREFHKVKYRNTTQPGYSSDKYIECLKCAKKDIMSFGINKFQFLEPETPLARIYDKLTFITGQKLK
jgi:hypothetical protein